MDRESSLPTKQEPETPCNIWFRSFILRLGVVSLRSNPYLEDHLWSVVRDCLLNIFAGTVHSRSRDRLLHLQPEDASDSLNMDFFAALKKYIHFK
jgi:hypothetical protein